MSDDMYDIKQEQYTTVIREMIRHENDVTNHRIMWLLIGQEFIASAFVIVEREGGCIHGFHASPCGVTGNALGIADAL
jgi:hypothetical protein